MKLTSHKSGEATILCPAEAITQGECEALGLAADEALASGARTLVMDLAEVPFIDSAALELLLSMSSKCEQKGGRVKLARPSDNCMEILRLTELNGRFPVYSSVENATKSLH